MGKKVHSEGLTIAELKRHQSEVVAVIARIREMFPEVNGLAKDDRVLSQGKMGVDEAEALRGVIDAMDMMPEVFSVLADEDEGHDPNKLETALLRDRLDRHVIYSQIAEKIGEIARLFSDAALSMGASTKPVALAGYEIAKPLSKRDEVIRGKIAKALDFYGNRAQAAAATRRANASAPKGSGD